MKILYGNTLASTCGALSLITGAMTYLAETPGSVMLGVGITGGLVMVALINALCDQNQTIRHATLAAGMLGAAGCCSFAAYQGYLGLSEKELFLRHTFYSVALSYGICSLAFFLGGIVGYAVNLPNNSRE